VDPQRNLLEDPLRQPQVPLQSTTNGLGLGGLDQIGAQDTLKPLTATIK
jgi:hypothetical protein